MQKTQTSIFNSIMNNDNEIVKDYLKSNNINIINEFDGAGLLHYSIKYNNIFSFKMMLENGIDINLHDKLGNTPVIWTILYNRVGMLKELINSRALLDVTNNLNESPILVALKLNNYEITKLLLEQNVSLDIVSDLKENIYFYLVRSHNLDLFKYFYDKNPEALKSKNYMGESLLHISVKLMDYQMTKFLLEKGMLPNLSDDFKVTPIFYAAKNNDKELISLLIDNGAIIEFNNAYHESVFDLCDEGTKSFIEYKIDSVSYSKYIKKFPLHYAVLRNDYITCKQHISLINLQKKDDYGHLAIEYAKELNHLEILKLIQTYNKNKR